MAVTASSLVDPNGFLTPTLFPADDRNALLARIGGYLDAASSDARVLAIIAGDNSKADAATRDYAYWRAYSAVVQRMNSEPLTVSVTEKGSHGYSTAQIGAMQQLAQQFDDALDAMLPVDTAPIASQSMGVPNVFSW